MINRYSSNINEIARRAGYSCAKEFYTYLYWEKGFSHSQLAKLVNLTTGAVHYHFKILGIKSRKRGGDNFQKINSVYNKVFSCLTFKELKELTHTEILKKVFSKVTASQRKSLSISLNKELGINKYGKRNPGRPKTEIKIQKDIDKIKNCSLNLPDYSWQSKRKNNS